MEIRKDISPGKDTEEQKCCSLQLSLSESSSRIREQTQVVSSKMQSGAAQPRPFRCCWPCGSTALHTSFSSRASQLPSTNPVNKLRPIQHSNFLMMAIVHLHKVSKRLHGITRCSLRIWAIPQSLYIVMTHPPKTAIHKTLLYKLSK